MAILIKNIKIVNNLTIFKGNILIIDDKIKYISKDNISVANISNIIIIDGNGKYAFPGIIDEHVHFREPGLTKKADIYTESKAAVAGGVTSIMDMPNVKPQTTTIEDINYKFKLAEQKSLTNFSFYLGVTNNNLNEIKKINPKKVCGIKLFMGSSTGNMLVDDINYLDKIFKESPVLIAAHCEDENTIINNSKKYKEMFGNNVPFDYHPKIRTEEACFKSSLLAVNLAKKNNSRLHILHLTTKKEINLFSNDKDTKDKKITAEVCVNHLWFDDNDYKKFGSKIKCNPAIKTKNDKDALLTAVKNNFIDTIATDHAPHLLTEKNNSYFNAPSGIPIIQQSLLMMLEFYHKNKISLEQIVDKMCHKPSEIFKIDKRGFIKEEYFADIVIIDLNSKTKVTNDNILYKCKWSPLEGYSFNSKITHTIINGNIVYDNGKFNEDVKGLPLSFNR